MTEKERKGQTERETERQRDRETGRQGDRDFCFFSSSPLSDCYFSLDDDKPVLHLGEPYQSMRRPSGGVLR